MSVTKAERVKTSNSLNSRFLTHLPHPQLQVWTDKESPVGPLPTLIHQNSNNAASDHLKCVRALSHCWIGWVVINRSLKAK